MKKLNQKGIAHHLLIVGIAVLVVSAVGFAGFRVYKSKNSDSAKAAGYAQVLYGGSDYPSVYACKVSSTDAYKYRAYLRNRTGTTWYLDGRTMAGPNSNSPAITVSGPTVLSTYISRANPYKNLSVNLTVANRTICS